MTKHGHLDASPDETQAREWWARCPGANVGIATSPSGLTVLDCDHGLETEEGFRAFMAAYDLPETYAVRTGRRDDYGVQMYYQRGDMEDPLKSIAWEKGGHSGDIRSATGYVMAAGSIHPDSKEAYAVIMDAPLAATPNFVRALRAKPITKDGGGQNAPVTDDGGPIESSRNVHMISLLGKKRNSGADDEQLREYALRVNEDRMRPPLDEDELERLIQNACKFPIPAPEPIPVISISIPAPEIASQHQAKRPVYAIDVWDGTVVGEFAKLCSRDNNIPRKLFAEAFRCVLGAVVGDRISCPVEGALPRSYTVIIAPKGKGKGTAIRRAVKFFSTQWNGLSTSPGLLSGERDFIWKSQGVGCWNTAASSVPGMARLCKDLEKTVKNCPHLTWGNTLPRILSVHEEMKTFLSTLFIEGGVGSGMEGVICQLWDDVTFNGTATGTREAAYGEMMFSLLAGVTGDDWFDLLSRGDAVGGGLMSRLNLVGTEGTYDNVGRMSLPDFTALQESFLPRVRLLGDAKTTIMPTEDADRVIGEWVDTLPDGSERLNVHAWRNALLLAWLRREESITAKTAEDAVRLGQYQVDSHEFYLVKAADGQNARVQAKIVRSLEMVGPQSKRALQRATHASRYGTDAWSRALDGLLRDRLIGRQENGTLYLADE